jgi:predicted lipoprotein with Yx(FWY)xxD motif
LQNTVNWKLGLNVAIAGAALLVAACGGYGTNAYGGSASTPSNARYPGVASSPSGTPAPPAAASATVGLGSTALGQILVDSKGRTVYLFEGDRAGMSSCYGDCASVWPPLLASGALVAGSGLNQSLLTTTTRKDGSVEVVYNGHPLYYFVSDKVAGDTTGQAISGFGASWYVLSSAGSKVDKA